MGLKTGIWSSVEIFTILWLTAVLLWIMALDLLGDVITERKDRVLASVIIIGGLSIIMTKITVSKLLEIWSLTKMRNLAMIVTFGSILFMLASPIVTLTIYPERPMELYRSGSLFFPPLIVSVILDFVCALLNFVLFFSLLFSR